jgi:hypothetical protein
MTVVRDIRAYAIWAFAAGSALASFPATVSVQDAQAAAPPAHDATALAKSQLKFIVSLLYPRK